MSGIISQASSVLMHYDLMQETGNISLSTFDRAQNNKGKSHQGDCHGPGNLDLQFLRKVKPNSCYCFTVQISGCKHLCF